MIVADFRVFSIEKSNDHCFPTMAISKSTIYKNIYISKKAVVSLGGIFYYIVKCKKIKLNMQDFFTKKL